MAEDVKSLEFYQGTVDRAFSRCAEDSAFRAGLKKAASIDTESQGWEYLAECGAKLDDDVSRIAYAVVMSSIAKCDLKKNGNLRLGEAILRAYDMDRDRARGRFRRLVACGEIREYSAVLRPILQFIGSKGVALDYASLLYDLNSLRYADASERIKTRWAQQFYGYSKPNKEDDDDLCG